MIWVCLISPDLQGSDATAVELLENEVQTEGREGEHVSKSKGPVEGLE